MAPLYKRYVTKAYTGYCMLTFYGQVPRTSSLQSPVMELTGKLFSTLPDDMC
jgi:hypothetical protein